MKESLVIILFSLVLFSQGMSLIPLYASGVLQATTDYEKADTKSLFAQNLALSQQYNSNLYHIPDFITSTSIDANGLPLAQQLAELNVTNCRVYCMWGYVTSELTEIESFTVEELRSNTSWIEPYSATLNFAETDQQVNGLVALGIQPIIEIGEGTNHCLPKVSETFNSTSGYADPGTVGEEQYLAYMYRYSRAVVHRYKANVTIWQIENELNDAYVEAVARLRSPSNIEISKNCWGNFTYVTRILQTLYMAVKDEDPSLWTTQNVNTDNPEDVYTLFRIPEYYLNAIQAWEPILDLISFDMYPNFYQATPDYSYVLANVTNNIRSILVDKTKPIMIAETGAHVMNQASLENVTFPQVNQTFQAQAEYLTSAFTNAVAAGIKGFQLFKMTPNSGYNNPPGGYSRKDVQFLQACTDCIVQNTWKPVIDWFSSISNVMYILDGRAVEVLDAPTTTSFGILDENGDPTPSFYTLQSLYSSIPPS